jgi:hypothetical protein
MAAASRTALGVVAALVLVLASRAAAAAPRVVEDDYDAARAEAKRLGVPIVVDVWAPW